ncbi:hypothetical protein EK904_010447 [Melospiza melodia maxima]|nr:hypothetical protein EK904_010447 [Melospiza melodia maxima]
MGYQPNGSALVPVDVSEEGVSLQGGQSTVSTAPGHTAPPATPSQTLLGVFPPKITFGLVWNICSTTLEKLQELRTEITPPSQTHVPISLEVSEKGSVRGKNPKFLIVQDPKKEKKECHILTTEILKDENLHGKYFPGVCSGYFSYLKHLNNSNTKAINHLFQLHELPQAKKQSCARQRERSPINYEARERGDQPQTRRQEKRREEITQNNEAKGREKGDHPQTTRQEEEREETIPKQ